MKLESKTKTKQFHDGKFIQLSLDHGSCDIMNNLYEIKIVENRKPVIQEKLIQSHDLDFIVDDDFEDLYDHELTINCIIISFCFKNMKQTFNNRIGLGYMYKREETFLFYCKCYVV
jgi:hypothetical protein